MDKKNTLGYAIFNGIEKNEYLNELYDALLFNYCCHIFNSSSDKKDFELNDLLRFADLLSKSTNVDNSEMHHSLAQEIVTLLGILEPNNLLVRDTVGSVLSQLNNYLGLSYAAPDYYEPSILERITNKYEKSLLQIPFEQGKYFLRSQKYVYDHMNEEVFFSYSGPTSMGKSFVMRAFISEKIKKNDNCNFSVIVPTRALINEVFRALVEDMAGVLRENDYRIVTSSGNSIVQDKNKHRYIFVMTPERMMYQLIEHPDIPVHYVFIDEAQNISKKDGRSAYYYQIVNMLMQNKPQPHIIFASPHTPNPEVYLGVAATNVEAKSLSSVFTPVSQEKFLIDMNSGTYSYYNPLSAQLKTVGKFSEMSLGMIVDQFGAGKRNLVYCNFKSAVVSSAVRYSKLLKPVNDAELIELAQEIREQIHPDYYLAYTVERGVAFHVGYIPPNIRIRIEELFRKENGGINVIFCTSTLLEGVNMPADNLFITDYRNGYNLLSDVEFHNLIGRVGRLQYSLYGNVFLICMKNDDIFPQNYVKLLKSGIKKQTLSVSDLSDEIKQYIVKSLTSGTTKLTPIEEQSENDFAFMRKTAGILLRDIMSGRSSMVRQEFESFLPPEKIKAIREIFASRDNEPDDDINVSLDQIDRLSEAIKNGLRYPQIKQFPGEDEDTYHIEYSDILNFLNKLYNIFDWENYEKSDLGNRNSLKFYARLLLQWLSGGGIGYIIEQSISYHRDTHQRLYFSRDNRPLYNGSVEHNNKIIEKCFCDYNKIVDFKLKNYFKRFSDEIKRQSGVDSFSNDWYEFIEYGTHNQYRIQLQKNGFSFETASYLYANRKLYLAKRNGELKVKIGVLNCPRTSVRKETDIVLNNMPELFLF
jgi:hypothetical protein